MRYSKDHKARTKLKILDSAVKLVFTEGFKGASVQRVMGEAGMTVGGFYAHFESKEDLLRQATLHAFRNGIGPTDAETAGGEATEWDRFNRFIQAYLSRSHRDQAEGGCPLPKLMSDVGRDEPKSKRALEGGLRALVGEVQKDLEALDDEFPADQRALATLALCAGGLALARAVDDDAYSRKILKACRDFARRGL